jgi:endonuclease V-like protein UPF0215 family
MKALLLLITLTISGCAMSKAPAICTFAKAPEVETSTRAIMADLPDSDKKTEAALALKIAKFSADAGCVYIKAVEAKP